MPPSLFSKPDYTI